MTEFNFAQQGWQCPVCKSVYSPLTPSCFNCKSGNVTTVTTEDISIDEHVINECILDDNDFVAPVSSMCFHNGVYGDYYVTTKGVFLTPNEYSQVSEKHKINPV